MAEVKPHLPAGAHDNLPGEVKSSFWGLKVCVERVLRIWGEKDESMAKSEHEGAAAPDIPIVSVFLRPLCQSRVLEQFAASLQSSPSFPIGELSAAAHTHPVEFSVFIICQSFC